MYSPVSCPSSKTSFTAYCPTGSTAVMSATTLVVTLGTPNGTTATANGKTTLQWTVSTLATDLAGNPLTAGTIAETGATDNDF